jgi:tagatose 6-phosphate kinase
VSGSDEHRAPRILAAGLSPAWQQILVVDAFRLGEVNRAREAHWCGSGKVLNVGIALAHMAAARSRLLSHSASPRNDLSGSGVAPLASSLFADGDSGPICRTLSVIGARARAAIEPELQALGVDCQWVETAAETRICTTIVDRAAGRTTELVENAPPLTAGEISGFRQAFAREAATAQIAILTGSLPGGMPATFFRELLESVARRPSASALGTHAPEIVLDVRGPELLAALACRPLIVKPNREEVKHTLQRELNSDADLHAAMHELNDRGAQWVVVTNGAAPVWASHSGNLYRFDPPRVDVVVNPIASGDCLAAGIAWATASGRDMLEAIQYGIAAAADNLGQLLPARLDGERMSSLEREVGRG